MGLRNLTERVRSLLKDKEAEKLDELLVAAANHWYELGFDAGWDRGWKDCQEEVIKEVERL